MVLSGDDNQKVEILLTVKGRRASGASWGMSKQEILQ